MCYILVTPVKNEEEYLPDVIQAVTQQTHIPLIWMIVDDGSTDKTPDLIKQAQDQYVWIRSIRLNPHERDLSKHYAMICNTGFDAALEQSNRCNYAYKYVGLLDADVVLGPRYYELLIEKFEKNPKLGIACGGLYSFVHNKLILEDTRDDLPHGGMRLWRRECFEETGAGFYLGYSADSISNVLAKLRGWETKSFEDVGAVQSRMTSSAEGFWKGYALQGRSDYFRNYPLLFILLKSGKLLLKPPYYSAIAYICGYFGSFLRKLEKIHNQELADYYHHQKYREVIEYYKKKRGKNKVGYKKDEI